MFYTNCVSTTFCIYSALSRVYLPAAAATVYQLEDPLISSKILNIDNIGEGWYTY